LDVTSIVTHKVALENIHDGLALMNERRSLEVLVYRKGVK